MYKESHPDPSADLINILQAQDLRMKLEVVHVSVLLLQLHFVYSIATTCLFPAATNGADLSSLRLSLWKFKAFSISGSIRTISDLNLTFTVVLLSLLVR
jgi:hypothetical protein